MKYYRLKTTNPYLNLAIEEYLFETAEDDVFMLWQNDPSVVVGVNQNIRAEVDLKALSRLGIHAVRRITGGGAVYHDEGNLNYTFIAKSEGGIDFAAFCKPVTDALSALGVTLTLSGRNDLCTKDGRKVSGNAECKRGGKVLHHGTLLFDSDLSVLSAVLTPSPEKLATKAIRSTRSRVANLKELLPGVKDVAELADKIEAHVLSDLGAVREATPGAERIAELYRRNSSDGWLYPTSGISSAITVARERRFPCGTVRAELSLAGDTISSVSISGDFFGERDTRELEAAISGTRLSDIRGKIEVIEIEKYIHGMSGEDFASLLSDENI